MRPPELCSTCRYFRQLEDDPGNGVCHYAPPQPSLLDDDEDTVSVAWGVWPIVTATDFCSEWTPVRLSWATRLRVAADACHPTPARQRPTVSNGTSTKSPKE
jgi:hypothetical protein